MQNTSFRTRPTRRYSRRRLLALGARTTLGLGLAGSLSACAIQGLQGADPPPAPTLTPVPMPVKLLSGHTSPIIWVGWRPRQMLLASLGAGDGLRLWNSKNGEALATLAPVNLFTPTAGEKIILNTAAWSPDGNTLAVGFGSSKRGGIRLWDVATKSIRAQINTPDAVQHLDWSADSLQVISSSYARLSIWYGPSGSLIKQFQVEGHGGYPAWSPDGKTLAIVTYSGGVALIDATNGQLLTTYRGVGNGATAVAWSSKGTYLAALANEVFVYQPQTSSQPIDLNVGFAPNALAWSADDAYLAAARYAVNIAQLSGQSVVSTLGDRHDPELLAVAWSSDGTRLATGGRDGKIHFYAVNNLRMLDES